MDTVLSGKTSQGRDVAYLVVINNWRGDQSDCKEKTRRPGGGGWGLGGKSQRTGRGKEEKQQAPAQCVRTDTHGNEKIQLCLRRHKVPAHKLRSVSSCALQ